MSPPAAAPSPSSVWLRYLAPLLVLASGLALSFLAASKGLGPRVGLLPKPLALWLLPAVSVLVFAGIRLSSGATERTGDLLLLWVCSFPVILHVLHLLFGVGVIGSLDRAVPFGVAALNLGFAGLLPALPRGSPFGLRLPRLLDSEPAWRRTHRALGLGFLLASLAAAGSAWLPRAPSLAVYLGGPFLALALGFAAALSAPGEEAPPPERPTEANETPGDHESSP